MWIEHVALCLLGLVFGSAAACGSFALAVKLGIIPRMAGRTHTARYIMTYENAVILGGTVGTALSMFPQLHLPFGRWLLLPYGLGAGVFIGCMAVALAEIMDVFPIIYRRLHIKRGVFWVMGMLSAGKMCGCLYYFIRGFG